jgi:hypothetical protein
MYEFDKTRCPIVIEFFSKNKISKNFGPLIQHGPHWKKITILTFINEKINILDA